MNTRKVGAIAEVALHGPHEILNEAANTFSQRNELYGDAYLIHGEVMAALLPAGIELCGPEAFARFGLFNMCVSKLSRYAANLQSGGHLDSAHDLCVYAAMLETLTDHDDEAAGV